MWFNSVVYGFGYSCLFMVVACLLLRFAVDLSFALCGWFSCWFEWFMLALYCGFLVALVLVVCLRLRLGFCNAATGLWFEWYCLFVG